MKITVEYDGIEERDEATDAIHVGLYRHLVAEFDVKLWHEAEHGGHMGAASILLDDLLEAWGGMKADLPRGGE